MTTEYENWLKKVDEAWKEGFIGELHRDADAHAKALLEKLQAQDLVQFGDRGIKGAIDVAKGLTEDEFTKQCKRIVKKRGEESTEWIKKQEDVWEARMVAQLSKARSEIKSAIDKADEEQRNAEKARDEVAALSRVIAEQAAKLKEHLAEVEKAKDETAKEWRPRVEDLELQYSQLEDRTAKLQEEKDEATEAHKKAEHDHLRSIESLEKGRAEYKALEADLKDVSEQLEDASSLDNDFKMAVKQLKEAQAERHRLSRDVATLQQQNRDLEAEARDKVDIITRLKKERDTATATANALRHDKDESSKDPSGGGEKSSGASLPDPKSLHDQLEDADDGGDGDDSDPDDPDDGNGPGGSNDNSVKVPDWVLPILGQVSYALANNGDQCYPTDLPAATMERDQVALALGTLLSALSRERPLQPAGMITDVYHHLFNNVRTSDEGQVAARSETEKILQALEAQDEHAKGERDDAAKTIEDFKAERAAAEQTIKDLKEKLDNLPALDTEEAEMIKKMIEAKSDAFTSEIFHLQEKYDKLDKRRIKLNERRLDTIASSEAGGIEMRRLMQAKSEELTKIVFELQARQDKLERRRKVIEDRQKETEEADSKNKDDTSNLASENSKLQDKIKQQDRVLMSMQKLMQERQKHIEGLDNRHDELEDECDTAKDDLSKLKAEYNRLRAEHAKCPSGEEENCDEVRKQLVRTRDELSELKKVHAKCPSGEEENCDEVRRQLARTSNELSELKKSHAKCPGKSNEDPDKENPEEMNPDKEVGLGPPEFYMAKEEYSGAINMLMHGQDEKEGDEVICGQPKCFDRRMHSIAYLHKAEEHLSDTEYALDKMTEDWPEIMEELKEIDKQQEEHEALKKKYAALQKQVTEGAGGGGPPNADVADLQRRLAAAEARAEEYHSSGNILWRYFVAMQRSIRQFKAQYNELLQRNYVRISMLDEDLSEDISRYEAKLESLTEDLAALPLAAAVGDGADDNPDPITLRRRELTSMIRRVERELRKHRDIYDNLVVDQTFIDRILTNDTLYQPDPDAGLVRVLRRDNRAFGIPLDDEGAGAAAGGGGGGGNGPGADAAAVVGEPRPPRRSRFFKAWNTVLTVGLGGAYHQLNSMKRNWSTANTLLRGLMSSEFKVIFLSQPELAYALFVGYKLAGSPWSDRFLTMDTGRLISEQFDYVDFEGLGNHTGHLLRGV